MPHAIGLHAWQALPLVGWIASRTNGPERRQRSVVLLAAGLWSAFLLLQAMLAFTGSAPVPG